MKTYEKCFTNQRLKRYSIGIDTEQEILKKYFWNILLSKELYAIIAIFEVSFRNHVNNAIDSIIDCKWLTNKDFLQKFLTENERKSYQIAFNRLNEKNKLTANNLVAELNLGFWINLCKKIYAPKLWHKKHVFESVFPFFDKKVTDRIRYIYPKLKEIQKIRNRISHHESVFDYKNGLDNFYYDLLECLSWMDPELKNYAQQISCFENAWKNHQF